MWQTERWKCELSDAPSLNVEWVGKLGSALLSVEAVLTRDEFAARTRHLVAERNDSSTICCASTR